MENSNSAQFVKTYGQDFYIIRSNMSGVFIAQILGKYADGSLLLKNARKIHYWEKAGAVEQISVDGICPNNSRVTVQVDEIEVSEYAQILKCTEKATKQIQSIKEWKA